MAKYEALINLTLEVEAESEDEASTAVYGEFMDRLLQTASQDAEFKLWADVVQIDEVS
jgi:hypothetical protein